MTRLAAIASLGFAGACSFLEPAVSFAGDNSALAITAARTAMQQRDFARVETALAPLTGDVNASAAALALLAEVRMAQNRAAEADDLLQRAIALEPENARWRSQLGLVLTRRINGVGPMEQAGIAQRMVATFERAVELDPDNIEGYLGLAGYYTHAPDFAGGSRSRAMEYAHQVRQRVPWLGERELGAIAYRFGDYTAALAHFAQAHELQPQRADLLEDLGRTLAKLGRVDEARSRFAAALQIEPERKSVQKALNELEAK